MSKDIISFDSLLEVANKIPGSHINRELFLRSELKLYCTPEELEIAVKECPAKAGIKRKLINPIAKSCIEYERKKATALSFVSGLPGGLAILGTIPADAMQVFVTMLRTVQKLAYLYGFPEFFKEGENVDSYSKDLILTMIGVMYGIQEVCNGLTKYAATFASQIGKNIAKQALTKTAWYPALKKLLRLVGIQLTKELFGRTVAKAIPLLSGAVCGFLTYKTFGVMARNLQEALKESPTASVKYFKKKKDGNVIDAEFSEDV